MLNAVPVPMQNESRAARTKDTIGKRVSMLNESARTTQSRSHSWIITLKEDGGATTTTRGRKRGGEVEREDEKQSKVEGSFVMDRWEGRSSRKGDSATTLNWTGTGLYRTAAGAFGRRWQEVAGASTELSLRSSPQSPACRRREGDS